MLTTEEVNWGPTHEELTVLRNDMNAPNQSKIFLVSSERKTKSPVYGRLARKKNVSLFETKSDHWPERVLK